jgi:hypothetical protein
MSEHHAQVACDRHGPQPETFVCQHLVQTLTDRVPRGFFCSDGVPPSAWCGVCDASLTAAGGAWTPQLERAAGVKLLCAVCYSEVKRLNGL